MSEIQTIGINYIGINAIPLPNINFLIPQTPPVTLSIGSPIIDVPGCVVFNPANEKSIKLVTEDDRGNRTLCDGTVPYFFPMDYVPEDLVFVEDVAAPTVTPAPELETPQPNLDNIPPPQKEVECPAPNQPRVGDLTRNGEEIVVGHELQGTTCVVLYEPSSPVEKLLPNTSQVSTTAAIAVVATAAAASTPLLLRLIKPLIKQATKKIKGFFGKKDRERFKGLKRKKKLISESRADD